ncbi:hypothetical protein ABVK25_005532 [Lepraria finkii]|uniref:Uncharacterized protein n=1 Tax=Lepraria finkii TaxID=1340010 RepID=A0ABR4BDK3_9LECA
MEAVLSAITITMVTSSPSPSIPRGIQDLYANVAAITCLGLAGPQRGLHLLLSSLDFLSIPTFVRMSYRTSAKNTMIQRLLPHHMKQGPQVQNGIMMGQVRLQHPIYRSQRRQQVSTFTRKRAPTSGHLVLRLRSRQGLQIPDNHKRDLILHPLLLEDELGRFVVSSGNAYVPNQGIGTCPESGCI